MNICFVFLFAVGMLLSIPALADFDERTNTSNRAIKTLKCYHPTGIYLKYEDGGTWSKAKNHGADDSKLLRVHFYGAFTGNPYQITVALLYRTINGVNEVKGEVLSDTALIPPNPGCSLNRWSSD